MRPPFPLTVVARPQVLNLKQHECEEWKVKAEATSSIILELRRLHSIMEGEAAPTGAGASLVDGAVEVAEVGNEQVENPALSEPHDLVLVSEVAKHYAGLSFRLHQLENETDRHQATIHENQMALEASQRYAEGLTESQSQALASLTEEHATTLQQLRAERTGAIAAQGELSAGKASAEREVEALRSQMGAVKASAAESIALNMAQGESREHELALQEANALERHGYLEEALRFEATKRAQGGMLLFRRLIRNQMEVPGVSRALGCWREHLWGQRLLMHVQATQDSALVELAEQKASLEDIALAQQAKLAQEAEAMRATAAQEADEAEMAHRVELEVALEALRGEASTLESSRLRELDDVASLSQAVREMEAEVAANETKAKEERERLEDLLAQEVSLGASLRERLAATETTAEAASAHHGQMVSQIQEEREMESHAQERRRELALREKDHGAGVRLLVSNGTRVGLAQAAAALYCWWAKVAAFAAVDSSLKTELKTLRRGNEGLQKQIRRREAAEAAYKVTEADLRLQLEEASTREWEAVGELSESRGEAGQNALEATVLSETLASCTAQIASLEEQCSKLEREKRAQAVDLAALKKVVKKSREEVLAQQASPLSANQIEATTPASSSPLSGQRRPGSLPGGLLRSSSLLSPTNLTSRRGSLQGSGGDSGGGGGLSKEEDVRNFVEQGLKGGGMPLGGNSLTRTPSKEMHSPSKASPRKGAHPASQTRRKAAPGESVRA